MARVVSNSLFTTLLQTVTILSLAHLIIVTKTDQKIDFTIGYWKLEWTDGVSFGQMDRHLLTLQEAGGQILPALKNNCIFGTF